MTTAAPPAPVEAAAPPEPPAPRRLTHKDLPETDGSVPNNFAENPQSALLNETMAPVLRRLYPDGQYAVGNDSFIYWRTTPNVFDGCKAPDWFLVVGVPPMLDGEVRRSYVLWDEGVRPLIVIEYVSGDGAEERDRTFLRGKFWVYENGIGATYYAIHDGFRGTLELWRRNGAGYHRVEANGQGRFPVAELGVELGLWRGTLMGTETWYVRPWDSATGLMLPSWEECAEAERRRAEEAEGLVDDMRREADEAQEARRRALEAADQVRQERERAEEADRNARLERERAEEADRNLRSERVRAEEADRNARQERERAARLAGLLRRSGIDPEAA
ncbi:MAG: Uma2 family endonuclease [Gemmataceae bacterium]|nr:Uma2 family endonuclease [Gemmataceae bacterium]